jgi:hypothetical protein
VRESEIIYTIQGILQDTPETKTGEPDIHPHDLLDCLVSTMTDLTPEEYEFSKKEIAGYYSGR